MISGTRFFGEETDGPETGEKIFPGALRDGAHEAVAAMTKYSIIGGTVFLLGYLFLSSKTIRKLENRVL